MTDVTTNSKPAVYTESGKIFYRASALGNCPRALFAARTGELPTAYPEPIQRAFDEGNKYEPIAIAQLRGSGFTITGEQRTIILPITESISVIGHIDGLVVRPLSTLIDAPLVLLEVKAFAGSTLDSWYKQKLDAFPHYAWQISAYLHALSLDYCLLVILSKDEPDETKRLKLFKVTATHTMAAIIARILTIERAVEGNKMPECEPSGFYCPFTYLHEKKIDEPAEAWIVNTDTIKLLERYYKANSAYKQAGEMVAGLRKELLATGLLDARSDKYRLKVQSVTSNIIDKEKLTQFLDNSLRSYNEFTKESVSQRLTVEEIGE